MTGSAPASRPPGVVVFAHVPPPHHGQSYAVQLLLERLAQPGPDSPTPLRVVHVDARLSDDIEAIGRFQPRKLWRILRYCAQAIGARLRHGPLVLYYIPAAPMRSAVYRDWIVMLLCRPWFRAVLFHWEAAGLADWLATGARPWERRLTRLLLGRHRLSVVLARHGRSDATALQARETCVVPNGLPDPCPDFATTLAPRRRARARELAELATRPGPRVVTRFRLLYLSLCHPEKGLFEAVEAVALANARLRSAASPVRIQLTVAGKFWRDEDRARFDARIAEPDLRLESQEVPPLPPGAAVEYRGFVGGVAKSALFADSDAFCFPSYYSAESFGLVVAEAMAWGLPVIATRWRHLPELFPEGYPLLVEPRSPEAISDALLRLVQGDHPPSLREVYQSRFTDHAYADGLRAAILAASRPPPGTNRGP